MMRKFLLSAAVVAAFGLGAAQSLQAGEPCCGAAKPVIVNECDSCCEDGGLKARLSGFFDRLRRQRGCDSCDACNTCNTCTAKPACAPAPACNACQSSCDSCNSCERPSLFRKKKTFCCPDHSNPYAGTSLDPNPPQPAKAAEPLPAPKAEEKPEPKGAASLPLELNVGEEQ
ncbi:MAG: hypothetical protein JNM56_09770 [Planctomycetia bacterium]|nr:hypothetical protein [Planctomycetia bacterium]